MQNGLFSFQVALCRSAAIQGHLLNNVYKSRIQKCVDDIVREEQGLIFTYASWCTINLIDQLTPNTLKLCFIYNFTAVRLYYLSENHWTPADVGHICNFLGPPRALHEMQCGTTKSEYRTSMFSSFWMKDQLNYIPPQYCTWWTDAPYPSLQASGFVMRQCCIGGYSLLFWSYVHSTVRSNVL